MGIDWLGGRAPEPDHATQQTDRNQSPSHLHTWWDDTGTKHETRCSCATGEHHTTPREGR